jgi:hypothetical protein
MVRTSVFENIANLLRRNARKSPKGAKIAEISDRNIGFDLYLQIMGKSSACQILKNRTGTDVMIFEIFSPIKLGENIGDFSSHYCYFLQKIDHNIGFF